MPCIICNRSEQEADIFDGIYNGEVVKICESCAQDEQVPLIKKPTTEQLQAAEQRFSVRERMEKISGTNPVSKEHTIALKNLAKIKIPPKKYQPEYLVENYYWKIQIARRRKKIPLSQLSIQTNIPIENLEQIERGQFVSNFEPSLKILEEVLNIKIFKGSEKKLIFHVPEKTPEQKQKQIIKQTEQKIQETQELDKRKKQAMREIAAGRFDFSKKEKLKAITLNDLIEMKRQREKKQAFEKEKQEHKEMFGDEIEIEEEK